MRSTGRRYRHGQRPGADPSWCRERGPWRPSSLEERSRRLTVACHDGPRCSPAVGALGDLGAPTVIDRPACHAQGESTSAAPFPRAMRRSPRHRRDAFAAGWTECDAIWASGDGADGCSPHPRWNGLPPGDGAPWSPAVEVCCRAAADDKGRDVGARGASAQRPVPISCPSSRPRTFSSGQLVTAGMIAITGARGRVCSLRPTRQRYANSSPTRSASSTPTSKRSTPVAEVGPEACWKPPVHRRPMRPLRSCGS